MGLKNLANDFSREPVPEASRKGWASLAAIWSATFLCIPVLTLAFQIAPRMSFYESIVYAFIAGGFATCLAFLTGRVGTATHLSSGMIFRTTFGIYGGMFPCLAIAASTLGWFGLQTEIFGHGLQNLLKLLFDVNFPVWQCIIFGALLMCITGAIGFRALMVLSYITIPLMLYVLVWPLYQVLGTTGAEEILNYQPVQPITLSEVLTLVAGGIFSGIVINPDFTRYMRSQKDTILGTAANFFIVYPVMLILGGFLAIMTQQNDFIEMMLALNLGVAAMIFLILGTWSTNDTNIYGTSLSLAAIINVKKWQIAIGVAVVGTMLALFSILSHFVPFLIILGLFLAPLAGVMIVDFQFNKKRYEDFNKLEKINVIPFVSWICGGLIGLLTTTEANNGFELFVLTTIPPLDGLLVAALVQFTFLKVSRTRQVATV